MARRALAAAAVAVTVLATSAARADEAADFLSRAKSLLNQARFDEAVRLLERAAGLAREPRVAARIQLHLGIGHWLQGSRGLAHAAFVAALTKDRTLALDPERYKPELLAAFSRARASLEGSIEVRGKPAGAAVSIDGVAIGSLPRCVHRVAPGVHRVQVKQGNRTFRRQLTVKPGARSTITVTLPTRLAERPARPAASTRGAARRRIWTWLAAGGAVVATATGIGIGLSAQSDYDEYQSTADPARYDLLATRVPAKATAANVAFASAGALAVGAVVLFLLER